MRILRTEFRKAATWRWGQDCVIGNRKEVGDGKQ